MKYLVAVQVLTYNQKDYIAQCLDSIVNQRTTFPFVVLVHDDASTDGTADIVRQYAERYPDLIHPIFQTQNQYSQGKSPAKVAADEVNRLNPKYKCILDGDDYWTDMESLQMRYDYLETHPESVMVYTKCVKLFPNGELKESDAGFNWEAPMLESLLIRNTIPIHTALFRMEIYQEYLTDVRPFERKWKINDWAMWLYMISKYKVAFINKATAVYRITPVSITRKNSLKERVKFIYNLKQIPLFFCQYSKEPDIRKRINKHYNKKIYNEIVYEVKKNQVGALLYNIFHFCISWIR